MGAHHVEGSEFNYCLSISESDVLILRPSQQVRSYQNAWGGIGGLIDEGRTGIERAILEIVEETGLSASDVKVIK